MECITEEAAYKNAAIAAVNDVRNSARTDSKKDAASLVRVFNSRRYENVILYYNRWEYDFIIEVKDSNI
jgi:hypothetical protein